MKLKIVAIRDIKTDTYTIPQFVASIPGWVRALTDAVNKPGSDDPICNHAEDFEAWELGEWDDNTAYFDVEHDGSAYDRKQIVALSSLKITRN